LLLAVPARPVVFLTQPDGSRIEARMYGDEFMKIITDTKGHALIKDANGFWCYARYDSRGNKTSTGVIAGTSASSEVLAASADVPYFTLSTIAEAERLKVNEIRSSRPSILQRMSTVVPYAYGRLPEKKTCLVILAEFSDIPLTYTRDDFERVFNEKGYSNYYATGSVSDYFEDQLGGLCDFSFTVAGPVKLSHEQKYYGENKISGGDANAAVAVKEACKAAFDAGVDFSQFDDDNDGEVDNVFVIVSGMDEAEGGGDDAIWAHQWYLYDGARIRLFLNGKKINTYTICSELALRQATNEYKIATIGTICHEYGHTLGLKDMYDTDGSGSGGKTNGIYGTGVMDTGCYNNDGNTPCHYNAIDYDTIGCIEPETLTKGQIELEPISENRRYYKIEGEVPGDYFLLECRAKTGWDKYLSGKGLAIYHVDRSDNKVGGSTARYLWELNAPNNNPDHMCAMMVTPSATTSGSRAFFPYGSINYFTPESSPGFKYWNEESTGVVLTDISLNGNNVSFNVLNAKEYLIPVIKSLSIDGFQTEALIIAETEKTDYKGSAILEYVTDGETKEITLNNLGQGKLTGRISDLKPGTTYKGSFRLVYGSTEGDRMDANFSTKEFNEDGDPYIYMTSETMIPLVVFDAKGVEDIRWYYAGNSIYLGKDGYYKPTISGQLKASIRYSNGDHETIIKDIQF